MKINIVKPFLPNSDELLPDISKILKNGIVTNNGEYLIKFEKELQKILKCKLTPIIFNNGEMALFNLIQYYKHKITGGKNETFDVIVPSFTFVGTINAITLNNLNPVFCDVDETLTINLSKIKLTKNTKLMVIVGVYGNIPNIDDVMEYANQNKIKVIFDNAPAFLSKYKNDYVCNYGFSEIYSFHASKIFNSVEGGCVVTEDEDVHENLKYLRDFGQYEKNIGNIKLPGLNSKMSEICAIIGIKNLEKIDFIINQRSEIISKYVSFFNELKNKKLIELMSVLDDVQCNYLYFPIILNHDATDFVEYMKQNNIFVRRYYTCTHKLDFYKDKYECLNLEYTEKIEKRIVAIPIHTIMNDDEINFLFKTILNFFNL